MRRQTAEIACPFSQVGQSLAPPYSAGDRQIAFRTATAALRFACRTLLALPGAAVAIPFCVHVSTTDGVALLPCAIAVTYRCSRAPCALRNRRQDEITIGRTGQYSMSTGVLTGASTGYPKPIVYPPVTRRWVSR
jgi:hypothetical protein